MFFIKICLIAIIIIAISSFYQSKSQSLFKIFYAIMITNDTRTGFFSQAIHNFQDQKYPHKHLIIINHGNKKYFNDLQPQITEVMIKKTGLTLGDLRNLALTFVPLNDYWITWDDDDVRSPYYFCYLAKMIGDNDGLFLQNRMEYNINNGYVYRSWFRYGTPHFLCKNFGGIKYLSRNSLEDIDLYRDMEKFGKKTKIVNNDPMLYIRVIHGSNTSLYVDPNKNNLVDYSIVSNYREFEAANSEVKNVVSIYNGLR